MSASSRYLAAIFLALAGLAVAGPFVKPGIYDQFPRTVPDFGHYYVAALTNRHGEDPYDLETQAAGQKQINPEQIPLRPYSGPWAFGLISPLTHFDYPTARLAWLFLGLAVTIACGAALWKQYGGADEMAPLVWMISIGGYAGLQSLWLGQLSPFVLAAFVGFTVFHQRQPFLAGLCLALVAIKPQNQLVVILIGTIWMIDRRQGKVFLGLLLGTIVLTALVLKGNPNTFSQYLHTMKTVPPEMYWPPLPATVLRMVSDQFWISLLPPVIGSGWGVWYYLRHRSDWSWLEQFPLLLIVSYLASPYGWAYDQIVFLFAFLQIAAWLTAKSARWWIVLGGIQLALTGYYLVMLKSGFREFHWVWVAPMHLALYLMANHFRIPRRDESQSFLK